jgi:hypothetical protein
VNVFALELFDLFWSMLWFFLFLMWIYLFVTLVTDIFRSRDLSGWGKAMWAVFLIVFPVLGALAYLVIRGDGMVDRQMAVAHRQETALRGYVQDAAAASTPTPADEVGKLVALHDRGVLDDEEFERQKARALA